MIFFSFLELTKALWSFSSTFFSPVVGPFVSVSFETKLVAGGLLGGVFLPVFGDDFSKGGT